jgi:hypothetical protein
MRHECELVVTEAEHGEDIFACYACNFVGNLGATIEHVVKNQFRVN